MMEVVAPATLSEGYEFDVEVNGETLSVKVPQGGVEEGQKFTIAMPTLQVGLPRVHVPVGQWRDGLCDCFKHGLCHNHLWTSCCCCLSTYPMEHYCIPEKDRLKLMFACLVVFQSLQDKSFHDFN
jgi:hypothetical protein